MENISEILAHIDPCACQYQEWVNVGMALKHEGHTAQEWDAWSQGDPARYKPGECLKKWGGFLEQAGKIVTGGTLIAMAKAGGWTPTPSRPRYSARYDGAEAGGMIPFEFTLTDTGDGQIVDKDCIEGVAVKEPENWNPVQELRTYLKTLFSESDIISYVIDAYEDTKRPGKWLPCNGVYQITAGALLHELETCKGDITYAIGDYNPQAGAWIRFNPLDGKGMKNANVTDFRYALVESDAMALEAQNGILRELELPIACLVHSGGKSLHAIVRIDAADYSEYRRRVDYLYKVCEKNGLKIDNQNRNTSRLSRMPGVMRNGHKQFLVDTNIGKKDWAEWREWIEALNDNLPDPEPLSGVWEHMPDLAPELVHDVLRQGHKMLVAGPSKAGKSFLLIGLAVSIAEGRLWLKWPCAQGRVLYVNLELDRASCLHRFRDVYQAQGWTPKNVKNIDIWNLRGKACPMNALAPKLIRRAAKKGYIAVIIDPIYKVITGDENSAHEMAQFCNEFDRVCTELGVSVIYCHHHSKGYQGGKRSMDRASGSGVFARDPDALLDMTQLEISETLREQKRIELETDVAREFLARYAPKFYEDCPDECFATPLLTDQNCKLQLSPAQYDAYRAEAKERGAEAYAHTAWRIEGTLREFPSFEPVDLWFNYPTHKLDILGQLKNCEPECEKAPWERAQEKRKSPEVKKDERTSKLEIAYATLEMEKPEITVSDLSEQLGVSKKTIYRRLREHGGYELVRGDIAEESVVLRKQS